MPSLSPPTRMWQVAGVTFGLLLTLVVLLDVALPAPDGASDETSAAEVKEGR